MIKKILSFFMTIILVLLFCVTCFAENDTGVFKWITGEIWNYEDWCKSEPNNDYNGTEDYLGTYTSTYQWNDYRNNEELFVLCEWDSKTLSELGNKKDEFTQRADSLKSDYEKAGMQWITQYDINIGSGEYREKWDSLLNEVYNYLKSTLSPHEFNELKEAEIIWIKEKEAAVEDAKKEWEGGSAQPWAMNATDIEYTSRRVYYLISLIDDSNIEKSISVILNGTELAFDQPPYIENGTTMVPMRKIFESLGATVEYDTNTKTITARKGSTVIELITGASIAKINGREMTLNASVENKNGTTMVPLRFVSETLGAEVIWDSENKIIKINLAKEKYPFYYRSIGYNSVVKEIEKRILLMIGI